jgi:hypothetical protein
MDSKQYAYKGVVLVLVFFPILLIPHYSHADYQTNLYFSGFIQDHAISADLDAGSWSAPTVYDWDSDGSKDLIVGRKDSGTGYVSFYKNYGTDASPYFNGHTDIQTCSDPCSNAGGG